MALSGTGANIKLSGIPTTFTDEAMTTSDNLSFRITNSNKDVWDFETDVVVEVDGVPVTTGFTINKLRGQVVFASEETGTVTTSGKYLPLTNIGRAYAFDLSFESNQVESTSFGTNWRDYESTINGVTGSISKYYVDGYFVDTLSSSDDLVFEFIFADSLDSIRVFGYISGDSVSTSFDALVEESVDFQGIQAPSLG